jgi:hypothetical protein
MSRKQAAAGRERRGHAAGGVIHPDPCADGWEINLKIPGGLTQWKKEKIKEQLLLPL